MRGLSATALRFGSEHVAMSSPARAFAFSETAEVLVTLGYVEARLAGADILHIARYPNDGFAFLLDWLDPRRLATHEIGSPRGIAERDATFDGVLAFLAPADAGEDERVLSEAARVLVPGGIFAICEATVAGLRGRGRAGWRAVREQIERMRFEVIEERLAAPYILVANAARGRPRGSTRSD